MEFSFLNSVFIPILVSSCTGLGAYFLGCRKQKNDFHNTTIDEINAHLDKLYNQAQNIAGLPFNDTNYQLMIYDVDELGTLWGRLEKKAPHYDHLTLKRVLTGDIFDVNESSAINEMMKNLSTTIHSSKALLKKRFI